MRIESSPSIHYDPFSHCNGADTTTETVASQNTDHTEEVMLPKVTCDSIDSLIHEIHLWLIKTNTSHLKLQKSYLLAEQKHGDVHEEQKIKQFGEVQHATHHVKGAQTIEKVTGAANLAIAAATTIISGFTPLAFGALIIGGLFTIDALMDDVAKKQIASWMSQGSTEAKADWLGRIHLFCGIISLGLSFGLTGPQAVQIALKVGHSTIAAIKSGLDHQLNHLHAGVVELEAATRRSDIHQSHFVKALEENTKNIYDHYKALHAAEEQRQSAFRMLFQKA